VLAMPGEVVSVGPVVADGRQLNLLSGGSPQEESVRTGFVEPSTRDDDFVIVG